MESKIYGHGLDGLLVLCSLGYIMNYMTGD